MFGSLRSVMKDSWYTNPDNNIIMYSNDYYNTKWQVFSIYKVNETSDYIKTNFSSIDENRSFINTIKQRSIYNFNVDVTINDKIITLSSCYDDNYRMVLHAKLIKSVKKN